MGKGNSMAFKKKSKYPFALPNSKISFINLINVGSTILVLTLAIPCLGIKSISDYITDKTNSNYELTQNIGLDLFHHGMLRLLMSSTDFKFKELIDSLGLQKTLFQHQFSSEESIQRALKHQNIRYLVDPQEALTIYKSIKTSPVSPKIESNTASKRALYKNQLRPQFKNKRLYRDIINLALRMGFTAKAVQNMRILIITGNENAFTTSGDKNRIDVFLTADLYDQFSNQELLAIVGHEFGHVLSGHTNYTAIHNILWESISVLYLSFRSVHVPTNKGDYKFLNSDLEIPSIAYFYSKYGDRGQMIHEGVTHFLENDKCLDQLLLYLNIFIRNFDELHLTEEFRMTLTLVQNKFLSLKQGKSVDLGNQSVFERLKETALQSVSQSNEKTADTISAAFFQNASLGRALLRLHGEPGLEKNPYNPPSVPLFNQIMKSEMERRYRNAVQRLSELTETEILEHYGEDHPNVSERLIHIYETQKYPSIILANPFMQLLFMVSETTRNLKDNYLRIKNLELKIEHLNLNLEELKANGSPADYKLFEEMKILKVRVEAMVTQLKKNNQIIKNLYQIPIYHILAKDSEFESNPLFRTTINYALVIKIISLQFDQAEIELRKHSSNKSFPILLRNLQQNRQQYAIDLPIKMLIELKNRYLKQMTLLRVKDTQMDPQINGDNFSQNKVRLDDLANRIQLLELVINQSDLTQLIAAQKKIINHTTGTSAKEISTDKVDLNQLKPRATQLLPMTRNFFPKIDSICSSLF